MTGIRRLAMLAGVALIASAVTASTDPPDSALRADVRSVKPRLADAAVITNETPAPNGPNVAATPVPPRVSGHLPGGLKGEYYRGSEFNTLAGSYVDAVPGGSSDSPDFLLTLRTRTNQASAQYASVRWTGKLRIDVAGSYRFCAASDDGNRLKLNGRRLIDDWGNHAARETCRTAASLTVGWHDLVLDYQNYWPGGEGSAFYSLRYQRISPTRTLLGQVPASRLYHRVLQQPVTPPPTADQVQYLRGVNSYTLAYGSSYSGYPTEPPSTYRFLAAHGNRIIRLPFYWGNLQPRLGGPLNVDYLRAIDREIAGIKAARMKVILDLHNSCRHPMHDSPAIFGNGISQAQFKDVWLRLSKRYRDEPAVIAYDLMNEPYGACNAALWEPYSNAVVGALRQAGDRKLVWVEGVNYASVGDWQRNHADPWIQDPANNTMYSGHEYFEYSGAYQSGFDFNTKAYAPGIGSSLARLKVFTDWLKRYQVRGSIGEVGWPNSKRTGSWPQWNALGESWYQAADTAKLWVTYFSATSAFDEKNVAYTYVGSTAPRFPAIPGISRAETQAQVIERHLSR